MSEFRPLYEDIEEDLVEARKRIKELEKIKDGYAKTIDEQVNKIAMLRDAAGSDLVDENIKLKQGIKDVLKTLKYVINDLDTPWKRELELKAEKVINKYKEFGDE